MIDYQITFKMNACYHSNSIQIANNADIRSSGVSNMFSSISNHWYEMPDEFNGVGCPQSH